MASGTESSRMSSFFPRNGVPGTEYLYLFLLFPVTSILVGFNLYHTSAFLLLALILYRVVTSSGLLVSRSFALVMLLYAVFLLYTALSLLWSPSSQYAMSKFVRLAVICTLLMVAPTVLFSEKKSVYNFFKLAIYATMAVAVLIILGFLSPNYARPYYLLGSSSHLAAGRILGFGVVVTAYYVLTSDEKARTYIYGLMLTVLLLGITVSGSRGPLVATVISTGVLIPLVLYFVGREKYRAYLFLGVSVLGIVSLFVLHLVLGVSIPTFDRIIPLLQGEFDPSNTRRLRFYRQAVLLWLESPLLGSGFGSYGIWIHGVDIEEFPHNIVLEILAELGVIGLVLFGAVLCVTLRPLVTNHREHPISILLFGLFVYALLNASFSQDLQGDRMVFAVIGLSTFLGLYTEGDLGEI